MTSPVHLGHVTRHPRDLSLPWRSGDNNYTQRVPRIVFFVCFSGLDEWNSMAEVYNDLICKVLFSLEVNY